MSGIQVDWADDDKNIILFRFEADWTWQHFYTAGNQAMELIGTVEHPVIQIFDMRSAQDMPKTIFSNGRQVLSHRTHPNLQKVIIVGMNGYFNAIFRAFEKMLPASWIEKWNMTFVDSLEDAVEDAQNELLHLQSRT